MPIGLSNSVLNQKNAPAIYEDIYANRPAAGFSGRIFISTDTSQIFVDTGSTWVLIANTGIGSTGNLQVVTTNGNTTNAGISITAGGLATNAAQVTGLTQDGGVLLTDASGNIIQDVNFTFDTTNNYLGIGPTGIPTAPLDIHNGTLGIFMQLNATSTNNSTIAFQNASVGKWRIGNLYSTGANLFHIYNNTAANNSLTIDSSNAATFTGTITGSSIIKSGGTSSQFLKANGSVDSNTYITLSSLSATSPQQYNNTTGVFSILQASTSQAGYLSSTDWNTFNNKASLTAFSATTPLSYNNTTGAFSIQVANSGQSGYLTNTDWNTFNNKQAALSFGNLTETSSSVLTIVGGTGAVIGSGTTIAVNQAGSTQSGYLSSTDWNTFNNKQPQINGTGFVKASGTTISYDNTNYLPLTGGTLTGTLFGTNLNFSGGLTSTDIRYTGSGIITFDTNNTGSQNLIIRNGAGTTLFNLSNNGNITTNSFIKSGGTSNQFLKADGSVDSSSYITLTSLFASTPLSYNNVTGNFTISQATSSTNGYLTSTDWNTFNGKQNALTNPITGTGTSGYVPKFNGTTSLTNSIIQDNGSALTIGGSLIGISATFTSGTTGPSTGITSIGDITSARTSNTGVIFFGTTGSKYLLYDGTKYLLNASSLEVGGSVTATSRLNVLGGQQNSLLLNQNAGGSSSGFLIGRSYASDDSQNFFIYDIAAAATRQYITSGGQTLFNGSLSSNGQGVLQNTGQTFTGGLGIGGLTFSTNTTATVNTSFYFFNGGAGVTLTMPDTNGQSMVYYIKNYSASPLTIGRTGSNTFIAAGTITTVTSLTLASGASATLLGNGTTNYIQLL